MTKTMRQVIVSAEYPPYVRGGLGAHYAELAPKLARMMDVTVVAQRPSLRIPAREHVDGVQIHRVYAPAMFPFNHIWFNLVAWLRVRRLEADLIHLCAPFGVLVALFDRRPIVTKLHCLYSEQTGNTFYRTIVFPIAAYLDGFFVRHSDLLMTTSHFMSESVMEQWSLPPGRVIEIPNGVADSWFVDLRDRQAHRAALGISPDSRVILAVGRVVPRKGLLELVQAMPAIRKEVPNALLLAIGGGYDEGSSYIDSIAKVVDQFSLQDSVTIIDWQDQDRLRKYYSVADCFVHPATYEPFGGVILEAMASKLPVVVSAAGGPEEVLGDAGVVVDSNEPAKLSDAVIELLGDPADCERMGQAGASRARQFSWTEAARQTRDGYVQVLDERQRRRKVLIAAPTFPPSSGGLGLYVDQIASGLIESGEWDVTIVTRGNHRRGVKRIDPGIPSEPVVYQLPKGVRYSNTSFGISWPAHVRRILRDEAPDVINVHTPVPGISDVFTVLGRNRPIVVTYHAGPMAKGRQPVDTAIKLYERTLGRFVLRMADSVISTSEYVKNSICSPFESKCTTISPGVDVRIFSEAGVTADKNVLFVGGIDRRDRHKRVDLAVRAFAKVRAQHPTATMDLVGPGDPKEIRQLADELGVLDAVTIHGSLASGEMAERYRSATVLVHTATNDNMPLVILEAMAVGVPVVASRVGAISSMITDCSTGFLIDPGDIEALASRVSEILGDPDLAMRLRTGAQSTVAENFSWEQRAAATSDVLASVSSGRKHRVGSGAP